MMRHVVKHPRALLGALLGASLVLGAPYAHAAPPLMPLHGYMTDADGAALDRREEVTFTLYDGPDGQTPVWSEVQMVTFEQGAFSAYLGSDIPLAPEIFRDHQSLFLGMAIADDEEMNLIGIATAPYASFAEFANSAASADTLEGMTVEDFALAEHDTEWSTVVNIPTDLADGDDDTTYNVAAGGGLELSSTEFGLTSSCADGQVLQRSAAGWSCVALPDTATATISSASLNGTSLDLVEGGTTTSVDLSSLGDDADADATNELLSSAALVGNSLQLTDPGGTISVDLSSLGDDADADATNEYNTGASLSGTTLSITDPGGSVTVDLGTISSGPSRPYHSIQTVTSSNHSLTDMSVTVGRDGLAVMCHNTSGTVVTHCDDATCSSHTDTVVGGGGNCSITLDPDGHPRVVYSNGGLQLALCQDIRCSSFTTQQIDTGGGVNSIAIGSDGFPIIAYRNGSEDSVKVAKCQTADCSSTTVSTIATNTNIAMRGMSMAIGIDGLPIMTYFDTADGELDMAHCDSTDCSTVTVTSVSTPNTTSTTAGNNAAIAIGADGLPIISRFNDGSNLIEVWHCDDVTCASVTTVSNSSSSGRFNSIAIGADGRAIVSSRRFTVNGLLLSRCADEACTSLTDFIVDSDDNVGTYTSIAVGLDGIVHVIYRDATNSRVKLVRVPLGRGTLAR